MSITVKTAAASEPVSVADLKAWARINSDSEDASVLPFAIATARSKAETYLRRPLVERELTYRCTGFGRPLLIPIAPVISVDEVRYLDADGVSQVLASDQYRVLGHAALPEIYPATGVSWPTVLPEPDTVEIDVTAGYGAPADIPGEIRGAVLMLAAFFYENREAANDDLFSMPTPVAALLSPHILWV